MPIKEQKWKVRVHKDKAGKGMFSHMIVSAKTAKEAMQIAADKNKGTDYPYTSSARKLNEEQLVEISKLKTMKYLIKNTSEDPNRAYSNEVNPKDRRSFDKKYNRALGRIRAEKILAKEQEQLDEGRFLDKHPWNGGDVTHRFSGKKGKVSYVTKEPTFSQMVPYRTMFGVKWEDGTSSEHKKEQLKKVKSVNEEQDMPIKELIVSALEETPSDFIETFDQAIRERIHDRIEDARFVTAINMFGDPEEVNEERSGRVKLHYPEHQRNISDDLSSPNSARVLAKEEVNES